MLTAMTSRISREEYQAILCSVTEHVDDGVFLIELSKRRILYCNSAAHMISLRMAPTSGITDACAWLLSQIPDHAFDDTADSGAWSACLMLSGPRGDATLEVRLRAASMPGLIEFTPAFVVLRDTSNELVRARALQERHLELQATYSRLAAAQATMLQSEKMASTGRLAAGVAHEINNPIGYVHSNLGTLNEYTDNLLKVIEAYDRVLRHANHPDALQEIAQLRIAHDIDYAIADIPQLLRESMDGIERVRKIVQDLKDFSHPTHSDQWGTIDLHKCIDSTLNIVSSEIKYKGRVEKQYGTLPSVEGLASELSQVFMNILVNAAQAMPDQGIITIETGTQDGEVWVSISDNGDGIPDGNLQHIFEPFYTTKPVGLGTGLGLSISYSIVKKHHGRIEVSSTPGQGATFRVVLPIRQPAAVPR